MNPAAQPNPGAIGCAARSPPPATKFEPNADVSSPEAVEGRTHQPQNVTARRRED
jgi:hypothetical protein